MSCVIPNKTEEVKTTLKNSNKLDYEEMRQRLLETERKLQSLNRLEAEIHQQSATDSQTFSNRGIRGRDYLIEETEREDLESIPSAISTVPGSYTGFDMNHVPASTPSRFETNRSNNKVISYADSESDTSFNSTINTRSKYDMKLLKQNQRLLNEVERLVGDIHAANQKNATLVKDAERGKTVAELEDRCAGLEGENKSQDKALRDAERHLDEGQRRIAELQKRLNHVETDLVDTKGELTEVKLVKREVESQRDEALHNFNDSQDSLEDYQRKTKDRIRRMEEKEDRLQEALTATSQERDDLLDQLSSMETSLASQEAQINRLLNDVNSEDARCQELEVSNRQLKEQLELMTEQLVGLEKGKFDSMEVKRERDDLRLELKGHRAMAKDLMALLKALQQASTPNLATHHLTMPGKIQNFLDERKMDDSGNFSFKSLPMDYNVPIMDVHNEGSMLAAELNCNNNGLGGCEPPSGGCEPPANMNMVCEMRNLVTNMDCEIQRLRCDLKQRDADDRTYTNLRGELKVLMDKVESGMCHNQELECQVSALDCDKRGLMRKLEETLGCLEERDRTIQCLETRLNERSVQIVCLQEDVDERNCRIGVLEQKIHDMGKRFRDEEENNQQTVTPAMKEAQARIKELEAILLCKNKSLDETQEKLANCFRDFRVAKSETEKELECLRNQLHAKDQEIDSFKEDCDSLRLKQNQTLKHTDEMKKMNRTQLDKIDCLNHELEQIKYAKEKTEHLLTHQLTTCEGTLKATQDQNSDLENALGMCRNEVCTHLKTMDDIRNTYESELEQRDACIRKLKDDLRRTVEELKCKMEDNGSLERSLAESRNKVQQICCQLKEADTNTQCLNIKIQELEKQMLKEKSGWMKDSEEMERCLAHTTGNLAMANSEIEGLKQQLGEKKNMIDTLMTDKAHMCSEIKKLSDQICCLHDQLKKMEADNQELCRQLQQKMECIRDMENLIRTKEHELKCLTKYVQDKEAHADTSMLGRLEKENKSMKEQLERCHDENKCKSTMLCECEEAFKQCQMLSNDKDGEIQLLKCQIDTLNEKLQDRISRVEELERGIENLHKDVERRMMRVDEQLRKYETELVDRIQEIGVLKECVNTCQLNLSEKESELSQQAQKNCLLSSEFQSLNLKLKDAEDTRDHMCSQLAERKGEVADLTQQLRLNREQMQKQHDDLVQSRQALSCAQRDADKLRRELDDAMANLDHRECEITRLNEERKILMEKVASLTCQLDQETSMLKQQMAETKCRLEKEVECLRNYICKLESNNNSLTQKLSLTQRQMMQVEKCCHQKLDSLNRSLEEFTTKLSLKDDELMSARDNMMLKDSEISRLKKRLCSAEKPCKTDLKNCSHNNSNEEGRDVGYNVFHQDDLVMESESHINLIDEVGKNVSQSNGDHRIFDDEDSDQSSLPQRLSTESDASSSRNSLGVTEVQERLRNNQLRQKEIERQLQSLEEVSQESMSLEREKSEEEDEGRL